MNEEKKVKEFRITKDDRDAILAYLLSRPMGEVEPGVILLRKLKEISEDEK